MASSDFTEAIVEHDIRAWVGVFGYAVPHGRDITPYEPAIELSAGTRK